MEIIGIDLSGPGSPERTAVARFVADGTELHFMALTVGADDAKLVDLIPGGQCIIGIDAPLSYSPDAEAERPIVAFDKRQFPLDLAREQ